MVSRFKSLTKKCAALFSFLLIFYCAAFPKYHPEIKWKEVSNERFIVVFPAGYEEEAVYTLDTARQLDEELTRLWGTWIRIHGKTRILLSDVYDDSNGSSTFFPYNQMEIYLFTPPPDSTIGSANDWIRLVLSHEMTHIFIFNGGSGFTYFMRKILGSNPLFYPTSIMPVWMLEGLAIYAESRIDEGGRLNTPDFKLMLDHIARAGHMPDWSDIWGNPTPWPGGTARYLYGAAFVDFLAKTYGQHKIPEFVKTFAHYPLPFNITKKLKPQILTPHQRFKQVFAKGISELWYQFLQYNGLDTDKTNDNKNHKYSIVNFLTQKGKYNLYPILGSDEKIYYVNRNYKEYPGIYSLDIKTGRSKGLIKKSGINGLFYSQQENKIYFSAADFFKSFYWFSDIYVLDLQSSKVKRLTRGGRLFYPAKASSEKDTIYCVKRVNSKSYLALLDLKNRSNKVISAGFASMAYLAVSPDNRYIAASLKRSRKEWAIALFNREGQLVKILTEGHGKCYYPAWKSPEELFFICRNENRYSLACIDLPGNSFHIYDDTRMPALRYFSLPPGENPGKIAASFFDSNGYNLGLVGLSQLKKKKITLEEAFSQAKKDTPAAKTSSPNPQSYKIKSYNFLRELTPKYITANYRKGGNEYQPGVFMSSYDLSLQHSYTLQAFYGFRSKTANFSFTYTYDGLYPTLSFGYSDFSDFNHNSGQGDFIHNERKFELTCLYPLGINARHQAYFYSNIHFETATDDFLDLSRRTRIKLNGIKLGFFYNSAKRYYDSISFADGIKLSLSYSREFKWMGGDYEINSASLQYKHYISLSRPGVLALQFGFMDSWGEARRLFYMGGAESKEGFHVAGNNLFDLMRGYPSGFFMGTGGYLFNIEYRIPLFKIENVFWIFASIERLYLSLFADIGNVWMEKWSVNPSYSLGMELNLVVALGDLKLNLASGIAVGEHPYHSPTIYLRLGNSF